MTKQLHSGWYYYQIADELNDEVSCLVLSTAGGGIFVGERAAEVDDVQNNWQGQQSENLTIGSANSILGVIFLTSCG